VESEWFYIGIGIGMHSDFVQLEIGIIPSKPGISPTLGWTGLKLQKIFVIAIQNDKNVANDQTKPETLDVAPSNHEPG